jgi:hypothetical protein
MHSKLFEATDAESVARGVPLRLSPVLHEVPVAGVAAGSSRFYNAIMSQRVIEVVVGVDGNVAADDLARLGVGPGDYLRIVPVVVSSRRSFLGAFPRDVRFSQT